MSSFPEFSFSFPFSLFFYFFIATIFIDFRLVEGSEVTWPTWLVETKERDLVGFF